METMFDTLLQLPMFQGLSIDDLTQIIEKVKLNFKKLRKGEVIIKDNALCTHLVFLIKGKVRVETRPKGKEFTLIEFIEAPNIIEPQSLFGLNPVYTSTYITEEESDFVTIEKRSVLSELFNYPIFRLNFANLFSSKIQLLRTRIWTNTPKNLEKDIALFIINHSEKTRGPKMLQIKMSDFATLLNATRLTISRALNSLQAKGIIKLKRKEIIIPEAIKLVEVLENED